ncbi:MAG: hypothetical protein KKD35_00775, partial [Elusimicrobia bacterium]|nr:hypothetical protein [Elusimicrobiota bacterium]
MKKIIILTGTLIFGILQASSFAGSFQENLESSMGDLDAIEMEMPAPQTAEEISATEEKKDINIFEYFDQRLGTEKTPKAMWLFPDKSKGSETILYSFNLSKIINKIFKTSVSFKTTKGTVVYVSGTKASNCPDGGNNCKDREKYFLVLTTDKGAQYLIRGEEIANVFLVMSGSKKVVIDGDTYVLKLNVKLSSPENSVLEIKRGSKKVVNATLEKLGNAIAEKSETVKLSREYKLACGNELIQGSKGGKFT